MLGTTAFEFNFNAYTDQRRKLVEDHLRNYLDLQDPSILWDSMRYSVLSGGKRIRALLCLAGAEAVNSEEGILDVALPCACAIEMVHAMSLIHDDLPCMDNDDFRRGKKTNHKVYGEAMALLAGDALLMHANDILIDRTPTRIDRHTLLCVVLELSRAAGAKGMVAGQVDDLVWTGHASNAAGAKPAMSTKSDIEFDGTVIEKIHKRKTGALLKFSIWSGAKLAGASEKQLISLNRYGEILGLAFQIADDLLDVTGDIQTLGKTPGKDEASQKATWVRVFGIEGAREKLAQLEVEGDELLRNAPLQAASLPVLGALLKYAIHRLN